MWDFDKKQYPPGKYSKLIILLYERLDEIKVQEKELLCEKEIDEIKNALKRLEK